MCKCGKSTCSVCSETIVRGKPGKTGPRGPRGFPGADGTSEITVKNTVFISKNGNDTTGLVERLDKPFLTFSGARTAYNTAFPSRTYNERIQVVVFDGLYDEDIILDKFVDFDLGNCVIDGEITDNSVDFGTSPDNTWTNVIFGAAKIHNTTPYGSGRTHAIQFYKPNTKVLLYADELGSEQDNAVAITNGKHRFHVNRIYTNNLTREFGVALEMTQVNDYTASLLEVYNADIFNVDGSIAPPVAFTGGGTDKNQTLSLINCRVANVSNAAGTGYGSAIQVGEQTASNAKINLYNTVLYSRGANSIYTDSGNTTIVKYYHSNMANVAAGGSGTLTVSLGSITVNTNVSPEF